MKISWGTGIVIAFVAFIAFIMYFVVNMTINKKYDHDFVTDDYYKKEFSYQNMMVKAQKTEKEQMTVQIQSSLGGVTLIFPSKITDENVAGSVSFYRPSDRKRDFKIPLQLKNKQMLVPINVLSEGRWNVEVNYTFNNNDYISIKNITIK
ncbi:cytochrome Cbb3 oxidase maturation protein CcoH [Capnocytophaga cynodegmi]|uniref:FixH family protein n=1 Tax=Capnocytophaga cynodegmi TaxID=28189 RepID=UPI001AC3E7BB|nr:FixH family protein [Capnocytophaga cynodegmi]GIM53040.1 cytochrome Cbb3 oxidase maturation protein CcoH [Capnocytophaga cynodegmi]